MIRCSLGTSVALMAALPACFAKASAAEDEIRLGMVGLDTSHCIAFTSILNNPDNPEHVPGTRVVAAVKGGSPDIPSSADRVDGYTEQLQQDFGIELVDTIAELCEMVDGVLITALDGRPHLEQARQVIAAGKPFFIDKPVAASYADVVEIARLAQEAGVPWFGGSSLRWYAGVRDAIDPETVGAITGCDAYSPCFLEPHHPDLAWYGVHGVEILYAAMGTGCETVSRFSTDDTDYVVGVWADGRIGTYRGTRIGTHGYGATVFGADGNSTVSGHSYKGLVEQIVRFFQTGAPPISAEEILEMTLFMEMADESKRQGGAPIAMPEIVVE